MMNKSNPAVRGVHGGGGGGGAAGGAAANAKKKSEVYRADPYDSSSSSILYKKYQDDLRKVQLSIDHVELREKMSSTQSQSQSQSQSFGKEFIDYIDEEEDGDPLPPPPPHLPPHRPIGQPPQMEGSSRPAPHRARGVVPSPVDKKTQHRPSYRQGERGQQRPYPYPYPFPYHPRYSSGKIQLSRRVKDGFPPFGTKSHTVDVYPTNTIHGKYIRHAITGMYKKIQGDDVHHFFKVSMCTGDKSNEPIHLYYFDPEEHEYHFKCQVSPDIKCKWMKQTLQLTTQRLQKLMARGDRDAGGHRDQSSHIHSQC